MRRLDDLPPVCVFCTVLSEQSSGGVGSSDYNVMFSTPPPHKLSPPGPDLDNMSCNSSSLLGASGASGGGHRYPACPEPTNTATSVYNTTPGGKFTDHSKTLFGRVLVRILIYDVNTSSYLTRQTDLQ